MLGFFQWWRDRVRQETLGGISDAMDDLGVQPDQGEPNEFFGRLAAANHPKQLADQSQPQPRRANRKQAQRPR